MKNKVTVLAVIISLFLSFSLCTVFAQSDNRLNVLNNCNRYYVENDSYGGYIFANSYDTLYGAYASENISVYYTKIDGVIRSVCRSGVYTYALYQHDLEYYVVGLNCRNGNTTKLQFGELQSLYSSSFAFSGEKAYFIFSDGEYRYIKCYNSDGSCYKTYTFDENVKSVFQNDSKVYAVLYSGDIYRLDKSSSSYCISINSASGFCSAGDGYLYSDVGKLFSLSSENIEYLTNAKINCIYKSGKKIICADGKTAYYNDKSYINEDEIAALLMTDYGVVILDKDFDYRYVEFSEFTDQASINYNAPDGLGINTSYKITSDGYITGVTSQTTVTQFKKNLAKQVTLYDKEGKEVTSGKIKTGYRAAVLGDIYQISVTGDVTGEGNVKSNDVSALMSHLTGEKPLEGVYLVSADYNMDGKVNNIDLVYIARFAKREN